MVDRHEDCVDTDLMSPGNYRIEVVVDGKVRTELLVRFVGMGGNACATRCGHVQLIGDSTMRMVILDPDERKRIIQERRRTGADRYDEVWNGVYVISPLADNQHQRLAYGLAKAIEQAIGDRPRAEVFTGTNVSDREDNWKKNFRCPDVAIFLEGNPAKDLKTHWLGGPDFAVEILSPRDRSRKKRPFYAKVGVRELLLIDRKPWTLELYRLRAKTLEPVGKSAPDTPEALASGVLLLTFRLLPAEPCPRIELSRTDDDRRWLI